MSLLSVWREGVIKEIIQDLKYTNKIDMMAQN
jgi:hypothetical protein